MQKKLFFIGIFCFLLSACSSKDNVIPPSPLVQFTPKIQVSKLWSASIGSGTQKYYLRLTPAVSNQKVFVPDYDGDVTAVDAATGKALWKTNLGYAVTSGVAVSKDELFVGMENGSVAALKQSDGSVVWQTPVGSEILAAPAVSKDTVLVKSNDGALTALSAADGQQLWRYEQSVPSLILHADSQPTVVGNRVIAGFANGKLAALNLMNGQLLWVQDIAVGEGSTAVESMVDIDVNPVVVSGVVYIATYQGKIAALDLQTGRFLWRHDVSSYAGIIANTRHIYLSDAKSYVWAFSMNNGAVAWRQDHLLGRNITGPVIDGHYVVVGDGEGYLHFMTEQEGAFAARVHLDNSGLIADPVVANNTLYAYTAGGNLYAFRIG